MYQPQHFRQDDLGVQHEFIVAHPLGLLISAGDGGLVANPVPFTLYPTEGQLGTLRCHVSRANQQWHDLEAVEECLVAFLGPQAYVSPTWYATKRETGKVVPTWNYATVHAWGRPVVTDDPSWLRRQIHDLTEANEGRLPSPWHVDDAPGDFIASQVKGIVGIEFTIARIEGKWKMSQNRPEADRVGVVAGLAAQGGEAARVGEVVAEMGRDRS
jgi:transcriptional regulator